MLSCANCCAPFVTPNRACAGGMVPPWSGLSITTLRIQGQVPDGNQDVVSTQLPMLPDFREPPWVGAFILGVKCSDPTFFIGLGSRLAALARTAGQGVVRVATRKFAPDCTTGMTSVPRCRPV